VGGTVPSSWAVPSSYLVGGNGVLGTNHSSLVISSSNTLDLVVGDRAPVIANSVTNTVTSGSMWQIAIADLASAAGWSDPDGGTVTLSSVGPLSTNDISVTNDANNIYYTAPVTAPDSFTYVVTDGYLTATGTVYLVVDMPPVVVSAGMAIWSQTEIVVIFSEAVDPTTGTNPNNYSLSPAASVLSAVIGDAPNKVILTTSPLTPGTAYSLTVSNVMNLFNNTIVTASTSVGIYPTSLPAAVVPGGLGVNIHFTGDPTNDLNMIQAAGWQFVRMDVAWAWIETTQGVYDFSAYDQLFYGCASRGIRILGILDYGNSLYGTDPTTTKFLNGFTAFATAAATHFKGDGIVWELWNEPNGSFWPGGSNPTQYMALANIALPAIRRADPTASLIAPVTANIDTSFLTSCFQQGLLNLVDAVSVHPYRTTSPETVITNYTSLSNLIVQYHPSGPLPIVSSEWGYSFNPGGSRGVTAQVQGDYLARMYLINLSQGIPISIWYDWIDDGPDPTDSEDNYGTVTTNYTPKPAYQEMQLLTSNLQGLSYARQLPSASGDYLLAFSSGSQETVAAWTTGSSHSVTVFGQSVTISSTPLYVTANTLTVTAASFTNQYGSPLPPLTVIYSGFVNGDTTNVLSGSPGVSTTATTNSPVTNTSYPITVTQGTLSAPANYYVTFVNGALTVTPAALTITANSLGRTEGLTNPPLTASYSGFVDGNTSASLTTLPSLSTTATSNSPPGTYPITVTNAVDPNYNISYVPGTLTVVAPPQVGGLSVSGTQLIFSYLSIAGETYQLQSTTNLSSGVWVPVSSVTGTSATVSMTNSINLVQQFFRLSITP
jgi:hypothetical protein